MKFKYLFIILLILFFSRFFSYIMWNPSIGNPLVKVLLIGLLPYCFILRNRIPQNTITTFVLMFMFLPFVSILGSTLYHGQSISESLRVTLFSLTYLFFFVLYILKVDFHIILKIALFCGIIWTCMEVVQQFTYPHIWFATRYETLDHNIEIRNGIYRFNIEGREFGLLLLFYSFQQYLEKSKKIYLLGIVVGLIGIYMLVTRQIIVAAIASLVYGMFAMKKLKISSFISIIVIALIVYINADKLFGTFVEMTEGVDDSYIRFIAYKFYGLEYNNGSLFPFLVGNGLPGNSIYGNESSRLADLGLYQADIGIVGMYSWYGIIYVITVVAFFVYIIKMRRRVDFYLQMYIVFMLLTSIMLHHFGYNSHHIMTLCVVLYLISESINHNKCQGK